MTLRLASPFGGLRAPRGLRRALAQGSAALALFVAAEAAAAPSSRWKVVEDHGAWWFVAPDGTRMLSRGVDCVGPGPDAKDVKPGRPEYSASAWGESYGPWQARTASRLKAWGFNSGGGWCDGRFTKGSGLPYAPVLHLGVQLWMPWADPWADWLPAKAKELAAKLVEPTKGDPRRIGYFLDNEFGWGDDWILGLALGWGPKDPGKRKLVEVMKRTYHDEFRALQADFDTSATSWDGLLTVTSTAQRAGRGHRAMDAWVEADVHQYEVVVAGAVRAADPGALIMGDRYRQFYPQAVARAARGVLDVVSTNFEARTADGWISPAYFTSLHELSGCPVVVGEYYATARENRSGNRNHGGEFTLSDTQAERARVAAAQARQFAAFPFVIGWHWFQWMDEPTFGRGDGEDYDMGLVDIYDQPYEEMTRAFTAVNADADRLHREGVASLAAWRGSRDGPVRVARQDGLVCDGRVGDWDKSAPLPRAWLACEAPLKPFGDVFLAWDPQALRIAVRAYDFSIPAKNTPDAADPATWGDLHRLTVAVGGVTVYAATGLTAAAGAPEDSWKPVTYAVPPAKGRPSAAIASAIDRWHYVWEVAIPAAALGPEPLAPGRTLSLSLVVENRGDFEKMRAEEVPILLSGPPARSTD